MQTVLFPALAKGRLTNNKPIITTNEIVFMENQWLKPYISFGFYF
jgi:hypothetical protein